MTKITDLAFTTKDRKAGNWRVKIIEHDFTLEHEIWHYGTCMLIYVTAGHSKDGRLVEASGCLGYGSVSDQGGMNRLMYALDIPIYYSRKGGAHFNYIGGAIYYELNLSNPGSFYYFPAKANHV